jgi:hypothetical protein
VSTQLQPFIRQYLSDLDLTNFIGVSLTLKHQVDHQNLDPMLCSQNLRHFMNVLNKSVYGNRVSRYGLQLQIFPVLEKSSGDRLHYHLIIEHPRELPLIRFKHLIRSSWIKTRFGHREIHIDVSINHGWIHYITKFQSMSDQVDWENVHLNR